ncbi:hypothetical protein [Vibrio alginolyticus]|uniref:hypothetical protein n=1 Tax=Vibrio alginolyticus TaxID=663 RepID=UPI000B113FD1|nr:hypothetical protein [Vibrio alginolyticus]MBY7710933.1 hypothetical protein [Vibrio alginolyticus]
MSKNPPPRGRNYPFAQRGSAFWEKCHVTFDQAVDMFYDQTAMQQHLGHDHYCEFIGLQKSHISHYF